MKTLVVDVEELYEQHAFATRQPLDGKCITCATCAAAQTEIGSRLESINLLSTSCLQLEVFVNFRFPCGDSQVPMFKFNQIQHSNPPKYL